MRNKKPQIFFHVFMVEDIYKNHYIFISGTEYTNSEYCRQAVVLNVFNKFKVNPNMIYSIQYKIQTLFVINRAKNIKIHFTIEQVDTALAGGIAFVGLCANGEMQVRDFYKQYDKDGKYVTKRK